MLKRIKNKMNEKLNISGVSVAETNEIVNSVLVENEERICNMKKKATFIMTVMMMVMTLGCVGVMYCDTSNPDDAASTVIQKMIDIICKVFRYVGVVLAVYSVGQLVMAFKNEDADSKSRATTMLVVACVLIGIKSFVDELNLTQYL